MFRSLTTVTVAFTILCSQPVRAQFFIGGATEVTQILNHGELVMQYIRQGEQLANELEMYAEMIRNGRALPGQIFGTITADLNSLASIVQGGHALAYSLANLDNQFRATFPGYSSVPKNYYPNYKTWSQTSLDTTRGVLRAAGLQSQQLNNEQTVLNSLRGMAANSNGHMQALQVMGQISEQQVQQLMKLREIMLADMTSKQAYQAAVIQHQAAATAATENFFAAAPAVGDGKKYRPGLN